MIYQIKRIIVDGLLKLAKLFDYKIFLDLLVQQKIEKVGIENLMELKTDILEDLDENEKEALLAASEIFNTSRHFEKIVSYLSQKQIYSYVVSSKDEQDKLFIRGNLTGVQSVRELVETLSAQFQQQIETTEELKK